MILVMTGDLSIGQTLTANNGNIQNNLSVIEDTNTKRLFVSNDAVITGNLTVQGSTTTISTSNTTITDSLIELGKI